MTFPETPFITVGTRMNLSGVTVNTDADIYSDTFQAIITGIVDWGDGTTSQILFDVDGTTSTEMTNVSSATVVSGHTYQTSGSGLFVITITVSTKGAADVSAAINALVR